METPQPVSTTTRINGVAQSQIAGHVLRIPLHQIQVYKKQPRKHLANLAELAESIRKVGQITAGIVRKLEPPVNGKEYELVGGQRRFQACELIGAEFFRAELITVRDEDEQFERSVVENCAREPQTPVENAYAIERLKAMKNPDGKNRSDQDIATLMGKSLSWVNQHKLLLRLHPTVQTLLGPPTPEEKQVPYTIALTLVNLNPDLQVELASQISEQGLSMVAARHLIDKTLRKTGQPSGRRYRPDKHFFILSGFVRRTSEQLEATLDMPDETLRDSLRVAKLQDRMATLEFMEKLVADFTALRDRAKKIAETIVVKPQS